MRHVRRNPEVATGGFPSLIHRPGRAAAIASLAASAALSLAIGTAHADPSPPPFDQAPYTHPQRLVTIAPGRKLNLYCIGHGKPAVIFDSGLGGPTTAWAYVQPAVARFTQACSYDRAGQGFSDPGPLPRDTNALVSDLHTLLHAAAIHPPWIFVGHSIAGLDGVLFADRYRGELAGMLLVDPAFPHQNEEMAKVQGVGPLLAKLHPDMSPCEAAARAHRLPTAPPLVDFCLDHNPGYGAPLIAAQDRIDMRPDHYTDLDSELTSFDPKPGSGSADLDSKELDQARTSLGSLNLIVLTAGNRVGLPGLSQSQADALFKIWKGAHDRIAAKSTKGRNQVVPNSSHYIQTDQPAVVIAAIHDLVTAARN